MSDSSATPHYSDENECPSITRHENRHNHRRSTDKLPASLMRIIMALVGVVGVGGTGGYLVRDRVVASPTVPVESVDRQAREDLRLLKAEIAGDLKLISQQLGQIVEAQKEARLERDELLRRLGKR